MPRIESLLLLECYIMTSQAKSLTYKPLLQTFHWTIFSKLHCKLSIPSFHHDFAFHSLCWANILTVTLEPRTGSCLCCCGSETHSAHTLKHVSSARTSKHVSGAHTLKHVSSACTLLSRGNLILPAGRTPSSGPIKAPTGPSALLSVVIQTEISAM